jgi:hypothetical protein
LRPLLKPMEGHDMREQVHEQATAELMKGAELCRSS